MNLAKNEDNNNNKTKIGAAEAIETFWEKIKSHPIISLVILGTIIIIILSVSDYYNKKKNATEDPNDPKNGPAAANEFINNVYIDEDGNLKFEKSVKEFWNEMQEKGNALTKYLNSPEQLSKLLSASVATDFPDTRRPEVNGESPDDPIDWDKYDIGVDSTDVQGIVKFKRALSSGNTITMTYLPAKEFQKKMNKYNSTGNEEDKNEALKYFTIERTAVSSSTNTNSSSSGVIADVGSRPYNNNKLDVEDKEVSDVAGIISDLGLGKTYEAIQSGCYDGTYYILAINKRDAATNGHIGGKVVWINAQTGKVESTLSIGSEGDHMEGMTYDSSRKVLLLPNKGQKNLIQIDSSKNRMASTVATPEEFGKLAYSPTTQQLIGLERHHKQLVFMNYEGDQYVEKGRVNLSFTNFTNVQGISCDGQVVFISDSKEGGTPKLYAFDYKGNKVEEHDLGDGKPFVKRNSKEVENCFVDKDGNLLLVLPHLIAKVKGYKANPVDWASNTSTVSGSTSTSSGASTTAGTSTSSTSTSQSTTSSTKASGFDIIKEAEKYVGKLPYSSSGAATLDLNVGADCSGFCWAILKKLKLYNGSRINTDGFLNAGTKVSDLAAAKAGDMIIFGPEQGKTTHMGIYDGNGGLIHEPDVGQKATHIKTLKYMGNIRGIRRFTDNTSGTTGSTATLGPVVTDQIYGQFSEDTRQRILAHCNDFNVHNYREFIKNFPGGYDGYVQSLGGIFEKYGGKGRDVKATDAGTFQEVAEYTWGLFAIWGFDYNNGKGKSFHSWGKDNPEVASSAYYPAHKRVEKYSVGHIDDICSNPDKAMRTNCNYGSNSFLSKAGLTNDNNFTTHWKRGQKIEKPEDFQIGDLVHFFGSNGKWHHVAVVGEIDPELGPILYDSGNRFIRSGNYKFPLSSSKYNNYSYWICRRNLDIDQSTSGQIGTGTTTASDTKTKYVYKVKVANWEENTEIINSTDRSENKNERNYSMNPITIPYQNIIAQYRMPFNYLWAMLIYGQDKNYVFDLADLVRNSKIEITIHDNLNETTTTTIEDTTKKYTYTGTASKVKFRFNFNYTDSLGLRTSWN